MAGTYRHRLHARNVRLAETEEQIMSAKRIPALIAVMFVAFTLTSARFTPAQRRL
jgi:hypothetical protein